MAIIANEDFTSLHNVLTGTHAAPSMLKNKRYPTGAEMLAFLSTLNSAAYRESKEATRIAHEYYAAVNNGLITPIDRLWTSGAPVARHALTTKGHKYLRWLERVSAGEQPVMALLSPRDVSRLRLLQAYVSMCATPCKNVGSASEIDDTRALMAGAL